MEDIDNLLLYDEYKQVPVQLGGICKVNWSFNNIFFHVHLVEECCSKVKSHSTMVDDTLQISTNVRSRPHMARHKSDGKGMLPNSHLSLVLLVHLSLHSRRTSSLEKMLEAIMLKYWPNRPVSFHQDFPLHTVFVTHYTPKQKPCSWCSRRARNVTRCSLITFLIVLLLSPPPIRNLRKKTKWGLSLTKQTRNMLVS